MVRTDNLYLVKDLSRLSGHSIHTIKFYLKLKLIQEAGRSPQTRFRYFNEETVERLAKIRALRKEGKRLSEIAQLLTTKGDQDSAEWGVESAE
jgi:DNA-binding transcriptional MerR regulator